MKKTRNSTLSLPRYAAQTASRFNNIHPCWSGALRTIRDPGSKTDPIPQSRSIRENLKVFSDRRERENSAHARELSLFASLLARRASRLVCPCLRTFRF